MATRVDDTLQMTKILLEDKISMRMLPVMSTTARYECSEVYSCTIASY